MKSVGKLATEAVVKKIDLSRQATACTRRKERSGAPCLLSRGDSTKWRVHWVQSLAYGPSRTETFLAAVHGGLWARGQVRIPQPCASPLRRLTALGAAYSS